MTFDPRSETLILKPPNFRNSKLRRTDSCEMTPPRRALYISVSIHVSINPIEASERLVTVLLLLDHDDHWSPGLTLLAWARRDAEKRVHSAPKTHSFSSFSANRSFFVVVSPSFCQHGGSSGPSRQHLVVSQMHLQSGGKSARVTAQRLGYTRRERYYCTGH